jgi:uncharacterized membrane protein
VLPFALAGLSIGWLALLLAAPGAPTMLATIVYAAGSFICHQRPERSFHLDAVQLPVCARCLGIYAGAAVGLVSRLVPATDPANAAGRDSGNRPAIGARTALILGVAPTLVTIVVEWSGLFPVGNVIRAAAGLPIGIAAAFVLVPRVRLH